MADCDVYQALLEGDQENKAGPSISRLTVYLSLHSPEEGDWLAAEPWPCPASVGGGAAEERAAAPSSDGGVGAARGPAAHHGQRQRQGLPHHGQPALLPEHHPGHGLHLWHRHEQGNGHCATPAWPVMFIPGPGGPQVLLVFGVRYLFDQIKQSITLTLLGLKWLLMVTVLVPCYQAVHYGATMAQVVRAVIWQSEASRFEVSLSKTPKPQLLLTSWLVPCMAANRCLYVCVCVWMGEWEASIVQRCG